MTQSTKHTSSHIDKRCLFRHSANPEALCSPLNPAYISLHGMDGNGGRQAQANVPADYRGVLLADSPAREGQAEVYEKLEAYAASFAKQFEDVQAEERAQGKTENEIRIKSLYLWSESPGTGKTTTAVALLNEFLLANFVGTLKRGENPPQRACYFLDANEMQTKYNEFNRPRVPEDIAAPAARTYYNSVKRAKEAPFAVIDDIGVRDSISDGFRGDLHSVINHRTTNAMPTVYTSNIPIEELPEVFGEKRLADRVRDMCMPIHFSGKSKRGARR